MFEPKLSFFLNFLFMNLKSSYLNLIFSSEKIHQLISFYLFRTSPQTIFTFYFKLYTF